jgi:tetratricopeptide (TPR) repeat protein
VREVVSILNPGIGDPLQAFQQAVVLQHRGRLREAEQLYEAVLKSDDRHLGAVYHLGLLRLQQGKYPEAAQLLRRAVKIDRKNADTQFNLANALTGLKRLEEAVERYEKALVLKPNFPEARNNLGFALQLLGRHEAALVQYEKALALRSDYAEARNNLGNVLQFLKKFESAIVQYEKALTTFPNYAEAHNNLGNAIAALGRHQAAIAHYEKALTLRPDFVDAYHSLGIALSNLGHPDAAIENYTKALAIRPDYIEAQLGLASALVTLDRYEEAMAQYDKVLALKPNCIEALAARAHLLMRMGRDAEGAELFTDLVKRGEHSIGALLALSTVPSLVDFDLLSELDKVVGADLENKVQSEDAAFVRAAALDRAGRYAEAWECLTSVNRLIFTAAREEFDIETNRQRVSLERLRNNPIVPAAANVPPNQIILLFILGPSRSGKTTLERLVNTLPDVSRGYEGFSAVDHAFRQTLEANALSLKTLLEDLPRTLHPFCRNTCVDELLRVAGPTKVFTNTRPGRMFTADIIAAVFPNVRFLCVKRNVDDTALRIYQRRYRSGHSYAYDVKAARAHVVWYHEAIDLLYRKLPELVRVVQYEDMVANPGITLRTAAHLCGLPMTEQPLPSIGDDSGCAAPYRDFIAAELTH